MIFILGANVLSSTQVGQRVVVRRRLPSDFDGTAQRPVYGDVLGILESWTGGRLAVRRADGELVHIAEQDVVAGKPIPPRPARRTSGRVAATGDRLALLASDSWPAQETQSLGEWQLRAAGGFTGRANSALVTGSPGIPLDDALNQVREFYTARGLPARAQVTVDSAYENEFARRGWHVVYHGAESVVVQVAEAAPVHHQLGAPDTPVDLTATLTDGWLQRYRSNEVLTEAVRHVLTAPERVTLARSGHDYVPDAVGRGVVTGDWLGVSALTVAPQHRRRGLGSAILAALVEWGREHGASRIHLQVDPENEPALRMYERLGFRTDHRYRYYAPVA